MNNSNLPASNGPQKELLLAYAGLITICIVWGTTFMALRIAVLHFPPFLFTAIRQVLAGSLLIFFTFLLNKKVRLQNIFQQSIAGFFMITMGNGLVAWGELFVPSGIAAIICSLLPLVVITINIITRSDLSPKPQFWFGTLLGFGGIVLIFSDNLKGFSNSNYNAGIIAIFAAVLCWAGGSIWVNKQRNPGNAFINAGLQMFFGGLWCLPLSLIWDDFTTISWSPEVFYPMLYLIFIGSILAYASYSYSLRKLPMNIISLYAYVNPIVAIFLGWMVLNEPLNLKIGLAIVLTILGIYLANRSYYNRETWTVKGSK